jgi:nickel/cobalt exporter
VTPLGLALATVLVAAHPLGNFTVNTYAGLRVGPTATTVDVVADRAEIPTYQARGAVDTDGDGRTSAAEAAAYADRECATVRAASRLTVGGADASLSVTASAVTFPRGQAGLPTTRITCALVATYPRLRAETAVVWTGPPAGGRVGWREVTATGDGTTLVTADVPAAGRSARLTAYPADLLRSPLDQNAAHLVVRPGGPRAAAEPVELRTGLRTGGVLPRGVDAATSAFERVVARDHLSLAFGALALLLSVALGAVHALAPGHGKTVMAAYLVGERGSLRQALVVGATVTATHTAGVVVLGVLLTASSAVAPDRLFPWLGVASGLMLATIGVGLLRRSRNAHPHPHPHPHEHSHGDHHHHDAPVPMRARGLVALGFAGGLVPSPSALVVLLGAMALGRAWFGVLLVLGYGLGMAVTLTGAGLLLVRARRTLDRRPGRLLTRLLPVATASVVVLVGLSLAARGANVILRG